MSKVFRDVICPTCGYSVPLCNWLDEELSLNNEVLSFCDMCESYLYVRVVGGKIVTQEC